MFFGAVGLCFALFSADYWSARLPLVMRDEANSSVDRLGRFSSQTELKAAQETILEMTKNPEIVRMSLKQIGPPSGKPDKAWPSTTTIDSYCSDNVNLVAPRGSEFGNTEVVYLQVKERSRDRATNFCRAMFENLTQHLRNVRRVRADSVIKELEATRDLAESELEKATARLREIESKFGTDLGDLRNLNESIAGDGANRRALEQLQNELQTAELELEKQQSLLALLREGARDPQRLIVSGEDLLKSQPSLQRLKLGLMDAQLKSSELSSIYTEENPKRRAVVAAENEIRERIQQEALSIVEGMQPRIAFLMDKVDRLQTRVNKLSERLQNLAFARTDYAQVDSEVKHRTEMLANAEGLLAEATATRNAALSTNLIAELGAPQVTDRPIGPGGLTVTAASTVAGLIFGLGAVFLIAPGPTESHGRRRWTDYLQGQGRRRSDRDLAETQNPAPGYDRRQMNPEPGPGKAASQPKANSAQASSVAQPPSVKKQTTMQRKQAAKPTQPQPGLPSSEAQSSRRAQQPSPEEQ